MEVFFYWLATTVIGSGAVLSVMSGRVVRHNVRTRKSRTTR